MSFKYRPAVVIGIADSGDYNVLPVSTVSDPTKIDINFDIPIDPAKYPKLNLKKFSYVRTHKQTVVHMASMRAVSGNVSDIKSDYPKLFYEIMSKLEQYNKRLLNNAF